MSRIKRTSRTTDLGLRILAGQERRKTIEFITFERAEFELANEGRQLAPFDRDWIFRAASSYLNDTDIDISETFVSECQGRLERSKELLRKYG